jgi:hypothetical protein
MERLNGEFLDREKVKEIFEYSYRIVATIKVITWFF